jgi:hypothetical protein
MDFYERMVRHAGEKVIMHRNMPWSPTRSPGATGSFKLTPDIFALSLALP